MEALPDEAGIKYSMVTIGGDTYLTAHQAGSILGVKRRRVNQFIKEGRLKAIKIAGRWMIRQEDAEAFAKEPRYSGRPVQLPLDLDSD